MLDNFYKSYNLKKNLNLLTIIQINFGKNSLINNFAILLEYKYNIDIIKV